MSEKREATGTGEIRSGRNEPFFRGRASMRIVRGRCQGWGLEEERKLATSVIDLWGDRKKRRR